MDLLAVTEVLERIAPLALAEDWDNVGLLVEPSACARVDSVLLTIDLTRAVLDEARALGVQLIVSYHPPIFGGLKRLTRADRTGRTVLTLLEGGIGVYSPHTALDAADGGVNDWLGSVFESKHQEAIEHKGVLLGTPDNPRVGQGRLLQLTSPLDVGRAAEQLKAHLGLAHLRIATPPNNPKIRSVALCPGAGGSVVTQAKADLYLTGEMRHHDVLAAVESETHVILTEHTNSERGYLPRFRELILAGAPQLKVSLATTDRDPLCVV